MTSLHTGIDTGIAETALDDPGLALLPNPLLVSLLGDGGDLASVAGFPLDLDGPALLDLHRRLVLARRIDRLAVSLARQGGLAVYASSHGQEAAQVGAIAALGAGDWVFPSYRDTLAIVARGVDPVEALALFRGSWHCGYDPVAHRVAPHCTPIGNQAVHAAGLAMAARLRDDPIVALAFFGDGATSEGDVHEAMNFAAVFEAPCVFFVQNNQYAISVPIERQTKAPTIAHKAVGYGMPGFRVDGNDILAVLAVTRRAVDLARSGGGPSLVEAVTYRLDPHTTADDPRRYRASEEEDLWRRNDPVARFERHLELRGLLDEAGRASLAAEADALAARVRAELEAVPAGDPLELFEHVYERRTPALEEQREQLRRELALSAGADSPATDFRVA